MKKILWLVGSLTIIAGICAAVLAYVDSITKEPIRAMGEKQALAAAKAVMPEGVEAVEKRSDELFVGKDAAGKVVGYAVLGRDAKGYGGDIELMVGFKDDRKTVVCYRKLKASETPGLGSKLTTPEFAGQFIGQDASKPLKVKKDGGAIEAITSATITSRAVCRAINDAQGKIK